ncbi:hypothetical protein [Azospirillum soli]|uniref:hypothetical protein n=1 Tax=Azospirillum soli TaxID=1304799 RepID=UPI001AE384B4|nr:hypothetical protein [Azospirillum soli]MBP2312624.1 hypothetical protein [Azospirillum soli]
MTGAYVTIDLPTAAGLWRMAETYAEAAQVLIDAGEPGRHHFDEPVLHLTEQAIELALKAFLRGSGRSAKVLRDFGHRLAALLDECRACGLDESILDGCDTMHVINVLVAVGKSGQGFRYPCNETNLWIEPHIALSVARRLLIVVQERCTLSAGGFGIAQTNNVSN